MNIIKSLICLSTLFFAYCMSQAFSDLPTVSVKYIEEDKGKGVWTTFKVSLRNNYDFPVWVLITNGEDVFPENGILENFWNEPSFEYFAREGKNNFIRLMTLYPEKYYIVAGLYLQANSTLDMGNFVLYGAKTVNYFEIAFARHIYVNGKIDIVKWLPFNFMCSSNFTAITRRVEISGRESDEDLPKVAWPKDKIKYLKVDYLEIYRWEKVDAKTSQLKQRHYRKE